MGDARSRSRLFDALSEQSAAIAVHVDHSGGADEADIAAAADEAVRDAVTASRRAAMERYAQAAGRPDGLTAEGIDGVIAALRAEAVDTLLVDGGVERDRAVWISEAPTQLATSADELLTTGIEPTGKARVDAAIVRAAACEDARFHAVGGGRTGMLGQPMADGIGALLRYPLPTGT
jgi:Bacterial archaeo-eukaryotic release factor family 2